MWSLTSKKRYHPATQYSHVTLHGATRHSSAALFLENPSSSKDRPSVECILELQNREDRKTFEKHYYHLGQQEMDEALAFGSIPSPFAPEPAASNLNTETTPSSDVVKEANTSGDKQPAQANRKVNPAKDRQSAVDTHASSKADPPKNKQGTVDTHNARHKRQRRAAKQAAKARMTSKTDGV